MKEELIPKTPVEEKQELNVAVVPIKEKANYLGSHLLKPGQILWQWKEAKVTRVDYADDNSELALELKKTGDEVVTTTSSKGRSVVIEPKSSYVWARDYTNACRRFSNMGLPVFIDKILIDRKKLPPVGPGFEYKTKFGPARTYLVEKEVIVRGKKLTKVHFKDERPGMLLDVTNLEIIRYLER